MLYPNSLKYLKVFKRSRGFLCHEYKTTGLSFGSYGLKVLESGYITSVQLEACRRVLIRKLRRIGSLWFRCYPDNPVTTKSVGVRMGRGKGDFSYWSFKAKPGCIILEIEGLNFVSSKFLLQKLSKKLGLKSVIVYRKRYQGC